MHSVNIIFFIFILFSTPLLSKKPKIAPKQRTITIMLDPAGDAKHTGRKLHNSFERGITVQCAEKLKQEIESTFRSIRVVLTRFPGEAVQPLQNANFANRLAIDFYISIHFYQEKHIKPELTLYAFSYGDDFITSFPDDLQFVSYDQAHLISRKKTDQYAKKIYEMLLHNTQTKQFNAKGLFKIPFKPLIGIKAPAIGIEISLKGDDDWMQYIKPIADSLTPVIDDLTQGTSA